MNIHLVTFGNSSLYSNALIRWQKQLQNFKYDNGDDVFKSNFLVDENDLKLNFPEFWNTHEKKIEGSARGYGYWFWKPFLIYNVLDNIPKNDVLFWIDCGSQLNIFGLERLKFYYENTIETGLCCFDLPNYHEISWTKMDTYLRVFNTEEHFFSNHISSAAISFKNTDLIKKFLMEWNDILLEDDQRYTNDSPSVAPNHSSFQAHRHDQSIFSLLVKKYNQFTILNDETYWQPNGWNGVANKYPIWITRNSGINLINQPT